MRTLSDSTFLLVGIGGLGCPLALALAGAGAGRIVLVDDDVVDETNLQRQILFRLADVGRPKVLAARDALVRRGVAASRIEPVKARFDEQSARALLHDADVVCEGSDDLPTKFLVNDVCLAAGRPFVIAAAIRNEGHVFPVRALGENTADSCYRCLFESPPDAEILGCAAAGILGATCGQVAARQARAAVALGTGEDPQALLGAFWRFEHDAFRAVRFRPRPDCSCADFRAVSPHEVAV